MQSTTSKGGAHRFFYDTAGRLIGEQGLEGRQRHYRYDLGGKLVRAENEAGEITRLEYDLADQLVTRELSDGTSDTFEYNACGELTFARNASGEPRFQRDAAGRIVRESQKVAGEEHWVDAAYDATGQRVGRKTSLGHVERITRNAMGGRSRTLLDGDHQIDHVEDLLSREANEDCLGGAIESAFDANGRLTQRVVRTSLGAGAAVAGEPEWIGRRDDGITASASYGYDADGEMVSRTDGARHDPCRC